MILYSKLKRPICRKINIKSYKQTHCNVITMSTGLLIPKRTITVNLIIVRLLSNIYYTTGQKLIFVQYKFLKDTLLNKTEFI